MNRDLEKDPSQFLADVAKHEMTVLLDQGLHRHLRFADPQDGVHWFEIVTWPGNLVINGDMGTYAFARNSDMMSFFAGDGINPRYWSEKLTAPHRGATEYTSAECERVIRQWATEQISEHELDETAAAEFLHELEEDVLWLVDSRGEEGMRELIDAFRWTAPDGEVIEAGDSWEWDFDEYIYHYLWCLHAIVWAVDCYRSQGAPTPQAVAHA